MRRSSSLANSRRGQSLVEFAVVALVLYMLLAAILTFGHMLYVAQGLQGAADLAAREISRTPLPATIPDGMGATRVYSFDDAMEDDTVRRNIYDRAYLVIDLDRFYRENPLGNVFTDIVPTLPLLNQQLVTLMIVDRPDFDGDGLPDAWYLRYPGALLSPASIDPPTGKTYESFVVSDRTVGIPLVTSRGDTGNETIRWVDVVEEIEPGDMNDPRHDPFTITNTVTSGIVALRINYPFQSASMSSFQQSPAGTFEPTIGSPNFVDDGSVSETNVGDRPGELSGAPLLSDDDIYAGTYGGQYGLGAQGARGQIVRPYRRVISAQAIYRRELFSGN